MRASLLCTLLCALLCAALVTPADAQLVESGCRDVNGIHVSASSSGTARDSAGGNVRGDSGTTGDTSAGFRFDARRIIDTTLRFDVAERRWTWPSLRAEVAAGASGTTGGTPGASAADDRTWHACAGAVVSMQQSTLTLRGAHGTVRLKVDLAPLAQIRGASNDSARINRRPDR